MVAYDLKNFEISESRESKTKCCVQNEDSTHCKKRSSAHIQPSTAVIVKTKHVKEEKYYAKPTGVGSAGHLSAFSKFGQRHDNNCRLA